MRTLSSKNNEVNRYSTWNPLPILFLAISLLTTGCSDDKDDPEPPLPPHPTRGAVNISCGWDACQEAAANLPATYIICIGENKRSVQRDAALFPDSLPAGSHSVLAYNEPAHIQIKKHTAFIERTDSGILCPDPGFLFSAETEVAVRAGETSGLSLRMRQRVRTLSVAIAAKDEASVAAVRSLSVELSGVVPAAVLGSGEPEGEAARLVFPMEVARTRTPGWSGSARLLGFFPEEPVSLTLRIVYTDGSEEEHTRDVTDDVEDFSGSNEPFELEGTLSVEEAKAGRFTATITDWRRTDEYVEIEHE